MIGGRFMKNRSFILTTATRDSIVVVGVLLASLAYGAFIKDPLYRMYLMVGLAVAALVLSFVYIVTNRPLPQKELKWEIVLNCFVILAMSNFIYKIIQLNT